MEDDDDDVDGVTVDIPFGFAQGPAEPDARRLCSQTEVCAAPRGRRTNAAPSGAGTAATRPEPTPPGPRGLLPRRR